MLRQLPRRLARSDANRLLFDQDIDDDADSMHDLSEDDVANNVVQNLPNNADGDAAPLVADGDEQADDVLDGDDLRNLSSGESDDNIDEDDDPQQQRGLISPNGQI